MIQPPARLGEGESAGRRPGGSAAEAGFARFGGFAAGPAAPIPLPLAQYAGIAYKLPTVPAGSLCSPWKHDTI